MTSSEIDQHVIASLLKRYVYPTQVAKYCQLKGKWYRATADLPGYQNFREGMLEDASMWYRRARAVMGIEE